MIFQRCLLLAIVIAISSCRSAPRVNPLAAEDLRSPDISTLPPELRADIVVAIDTSRSAAAASMIDVDGDGLIGVNTEFEQTPVPLRPTTESSSDADDTILAAELASVAQMLDAVRDHDIRVALVAFAGNMDPVLRVQSGPPAGNAWIVRPLGLDPIALADGLHSIYAAGPEGATDFSAAINQSRAILCSADANQPPLDRQRRLLLVTDGVPSLPHGRGDVIDAGDNADAIDAARKAASCGIRIDIVIFGPMAIANPKITRDVAGTARGRTFSVLGPRTLRSALLQALSEP